MYTYTIYMTAKTQNNLKAHVVALEQQEENLDLIKEVRKEKGDKGENPD